MQNKSNACSSEVCTIRIATTVSISIFVFANLLAFDTDTFWMSLRILFLVILCFGMMTSVTLITNGLGYAVISCYTFLFCAQFLPHWLSLLIVLISGSYGCLILIKSFHATRKSATEEIIFLIVIAILIYGVTTVTAFNMDAYLSSSLIHKDTLFHASIAAMIKDFGVVSTGLNGLVNTPYHVLSHVFMGSVSFLTDVPIINVYGIMPYLFFAPLLVATLSYATFGQIPVTEHKHMWILTAVALAAIPIFFENWGVWASYYISESYLVALIPIVLVVQLLSQPVLKNKDLLLVALLILIASASKAPSGLMMLVLFFTRAFFVSKAKEKIFVLCAFSITAFLTYLIVFSPAQSNKSTISFQPLDFIRSYVLGGEFVNSTIINMSTDSLVLSQLAFAMITVLVFILIHFSVPLVVISAGVRKGDRLYDILSTPNTAYPIVLMAAGLFIVLFFAIPGGSAYYFTNVSYIGCLPWFMALIFKASSNIDFKKNKYYFGIIPIIFIIGISLWKELLNKSDFSIPVKSITEEKKQFFADLKKIGKLTEEKDFLNADDLDFLLALSPIKDCGARLFVFPAITERAWLGLTRNEDGCEYGDYYSFMKYRNASTGMFFDARKAPEEASVETVTVDDLRIRLAP